MLDSQKSMFYVNYETGKIQERPIFSETDKTVKVYADFYQNSRGREYLYFNYCPNDNLLDEHYKKTENSGYYDSIVDAAKAVREYHSKKINAIVKRLNEAKANEKQAYENVLKD